MNPQLSPKVREETRDYVVNGRQVPAICKPSSFRSYRSFVDGRKFVRNSASAASKVECCLTCYDAGDCISFSYDFMKSECHQYIGTQVVDTHSKSEVCPSGVGQGYEELPGYPFRPGHHGQEYGPCLGSTRQMATDKGLDNQGDSSGDQQIFRLPREEVQSGDEGSFELR